MPVWLLFPGWAVHIAEPVRLGRAWASPTLAWPHCTCVCMFAWCLLACWLGLTTYHKSLPALILHILHHALIQKGLGDDRREPWTVYLLDGKTTMETTHGLTYSVARATEVTTWQSVAAVCHCCLTHGSCHWTQSLLVTANGGYLQCTSIKLARVLYLSMPSLYDLQCVLDQPVCSTLWLRVPVLYMSVSYAFCVISCGLRFAHILMTVMYTCTHSGLPYCVMHSSSYHLVQKMAFSCS